MHWLRNSARAGLAVALVAAGTCAAAAQNASRSAPPPGPSARIARATPSAPCHTGPHGGTLWQVDGVQPETVVQTGGIKIYLYSRSGQPIEPDGTRGVATLRVQGNAKRYRYDLFPGGDGSLSLPVDFSRISGRQITVDYQLVGIDAAERSPVTYRDVVTVPADKAQQQSVAIARQKICPVSGKPLGSEMGEAIAVDSGGQTVYVCCAGCVGKVKANPAKYTSTRPEVRVVETEKSDAPLIAEQGTCPVMDGPLDSMGGPVKLLVGGQPLFLCCKGCVKKVKAEPEKYLAMAGKNKVRKPPQSQASGGKQVRPGVYRVTAADQPFIAAQKMCPVMDEPLKAMGGPYRVSADAKIVYICCPGCANKIAAAPAKYLSELARQGVNPPVIR